MQPSINPWKPRESVTGQHVSDIVTEALQGWIQRAKVPYELEGARDTFHISHEDMFKMTQIVRAILNRNSDVITNHFKGETDD